MTFPQAKTIAQALHIDNASAMRVRMLMDLRLNPMTYAPVRAWAAACLHKPSPHKPETIMLGINQEIEGFGCEAIFGNNVKWPDMEYVNMGDTYATTVIYDYTRSRFLLMSYGDWVEREERNGRRYE